ncbi:PASTA domain-containing protein [Actinoplanes sp. TBRC 11911]|uniref:PASTA domain-containing protein n=1 Tax=Actinoplanes sp. TBRC 11911 TaxID=2729386 RepID=UPI00145D4FD0|nr:PASTA domain-containing protein [Actinoplanes sp. TBRC 11911]NMO53962.1 PASTA domain-containing protein [Actinoplanes sp. TBRC 11911]
MSGLRSGRARASAALMAGGLLAFTGCTSPDTAPAPAPAPTTVSATSRSATPAETEASPKAARIKVPDGVGLDYQSAQDLWRAAGLHVAPATDATGAHRIPVLDRNWVVVAQSPKAGATVDDGSFVTATVKKSTDD